MRMYTTYDISNAFRYYLYILCVCMIFVCILFDFIDKYLSDDQYYARYNIHISFVEPKFASRSVVILADIQYSNVQD